LLIELRSVKSSPLAESNKQGTHGKRANKDKQAEVTRISG
jgi:hypothetical protein